MIVVLNCVQKRSGISVKFCVPDYSYYPWSSIACSVEFVSTCLFPQWYFLHFFFHWTFLPASLTVLNFRVFNMVGALVKSQHCHEFFLFFITVIYHEFVNKITASNSVLVASSVNPAFFCGFRQLWLVRFEKHDLIAFM